MNSFVFHFCLLFILSCLDKNTFAAVRDTMIYIKIMLNLLVDLPFMCCPNASLFKLKTKPKKPKPKNQLWERKVQIFTLLNICVLLYATEIYFPSVYFTSITKDLSYKHLPD